MQLYNAVMAETVRDLWDDKYNGIDGNISMNFEIFETWSVWEECTEVGVKEQTKQIQHCCIAFFK